MPNTDKNTHDAALVVNATEAKTRFGRMLASVARGGRVVIKKHNDPKAVLLSIEDFDTLSRANQIQLNALSSEFDAMLARMQEPESRAAMKAAFDSSPEQLGRAAVAAARRRG